MHPTLQQSTLTGSARRALWGVLVTIWSVQGCGGSPTPNNPPPAAARTGSQRAPTSDAGAPAGGSAAPNDEALARQYANAPSLERFNGTASYYSDSLAGNKTASGERYQPSALTAAHRSLPFESVVRVTRLDTGQVVYVRITDRGPFVRGRVLDLSRAAAQRLGLISRGVGKVRADVVAYGAGKRKASRRRTKK